MCRIWPQVQRFLPLPAAAERLQVDHLLGRMSGFSGGGRDGAMICNHTLTTDAVEFPSDSWPQGRARAHHIQQRPQRLQRLARHDSMPIESDAIDRVLL